MFKKMNDYWHIPRASLASSSSASSASSTHRSSKTKPPTLEQNSSLGPMKQRKDRQLLDGNTTTMKMAYRGNGQTRVGIANHANNARRDSELSGKRAATTASATAVVLAAASVSTTSMEKVASSTKRGSRSSQGSSGSSNNSTRSAASGSLLLTAANLERFAAIHKKQQQMPTQHNKLCMELVPTIGGNSNTNGINWTKALQKQHLRHPQQHPQQHSKHNTCADNEATIIMMDPNLDFIKTKDLDTVSIASSMHFTMVNGEGGPPKKPKRGLCDRGRQVTVLIVSMSTIFLLLILGMVYALEMRAREMPQS